MVYMSENYFASFVIISWYSTFQNQESVIWIDLWSKNS